VRALFPGILSPPVEISAVGQFPDTDADVYASKVLDPALQR
jgi:hypothetical protein